MNLPARSDRGQATVELALALPFLCLFLLAVVQVAVVVGSQLSVVAAAREGARAAAVAADPASAAVDAAERATDLRPIDVTTDVGATAVTVTVTYTDPTDSPMVGAVLPDVALTASVTMALEPP